MWQPLTAGNYTNPYYNKNVPGFVSACEFYMEGNPGEVTLSVEHDLNVYLNLFYLDEETGMFERVENQENNGTVTTAKVDGTKTYALLDEWAYRNYKDQKNKYFNGMDVVFLVDNSGPMWEMDTIGKRQEIVNNILGSLQKDKTIFTTCVMYQNFG